MPYREELDYWIEAVSTELGRLSKTQARVLGLYSYGMAMTCHSGQSIVSTFLALLLRLPLGNMKQRLREWNYEAQDKRGKKRQAVQVEAQFAGLLRWIMGYWREKKQLILVCDVTYLRNRHTILVVSVVYRGCALSVAWQVLRSEEKGEWHPLWVSLLNPLVSAVPKTCQVLVLCDRGLYSKRLFEHISHLGWHPLMRIRTQGLFRRCHAKKWRALDTLAYRGMKSQRLRVQCFKGDPLLCTLWVHWQAKYAEPCLLVTDLAPQQLNGQPYALRSWIECGFKDLKRGGLHWQQSKITDPQRMARLLLVMSLALFCLVRQGSAQADDLLREATPAALSCATLGWLSTLVYALHRQLLPAVYFVPYSLPPLPS